MEGDARVSVRMDFQRGEIAEASVISGDYKLSRVHFEKFIYGFEEVGFEEVDFKKFVYGSEEGWSEGFGCFCLSVVLVFKVFNKAGEDEAQGILVVPDWLGSVMAREIKYCEQLGLVARWPGGQETR